MRRRAWSQFNVTFNPLTIAKKRREEGWKPCPCGCGRFFDPFWVEMRMAGLVPPKRDSK